MSDKQFSLLFWQISRAVLTPLLLVSITLFYQVYNFTPQTTLHTYYAYPLMFEHVLCGVMLYLIFSLLLVRIHRTKLHDSRK